MFLQWNNFTLKKNLKRTVTIMVPVAREKATFFSCDIFWSFGSIAFKFSGMIH